MCPKDTGYKKYDSYQTNTSENNTMHDNVIIIDYDSKYSLEGLFKYYTSHNKDEIYKFLKSHPPLVEVLYQILELISKYFKSAKLLLKFVPDYEFEKLNQIVVYICADKYSFDKNWDLLNKLEDEIRKKDMDFSVSNLFSLDLW